MFRQKILGLLQKTGKWMKNDSVVACLAKEGIIFQVNANERDILITGGSLRGVNGLIRGSY